MRETPPHPLLDLPPYPADGYARLADRLGRLLGTRNDVLLVQGEAIVALEAAATSIASPAVAALNIVTRPYGALFGEWLRRGGARVHDLVAEPARPVSVEAVAAAFAETAGIGLVSLVHAESASGILNPLPAIARLARQHGALLVVDAVASFGGHDLDVDTLGIDVAVIGPQKALAGSSGISAVALGERAWRLVDRPDAPSRSTLSLSDLKRDWLDAGRGALPGMPSALEFAALDAALERIEAEGLAAVVARHRTAAAATRAAVLALGLDCWVDGDRASNLVTAVALPAGIRFADIVRHAPANGADLSAGVGPGAEGLLRLNHTGRRAAKDAVLANVVALATALTGLGIAADVARASAAVTARYG